MAAQNLSIDREFRYIIMWFNECSELQKEDFIPVLVEYFTRNSHASNGIYMNGLVNAVGNVGIDNKPMSLFQCRIKLFKEWSVKWPVDFKHKLQEKITEIDPKVGEKIMNEMREHNGIHLNGNSVENIDDQEISTAVAMNITETVLPTASAVNGDIVNAAIAIVHDTEEAILSDNRLVAILNNETSVDTDDNINENNSDNVAHVIEPAGQVQDQNIVQEQEEHSVVVIPASTILNSAEVPLVA